MMACVPPWEIETSHFSVFILKSFSHDGPLFIIQKQKTKNQATFPL